MESIEIVFCTFWLVMIALGAGYGLHAILEDFQSPMGSEFSRKGWATLGRVLLWLDETIWFWAYHLHNRLSRLADHCECKADPGFNP